MRRLVLAGLAAATFGASTAPQPAHAYGYFGGGFALGTVVGLGVGAALVRPYYPYPYYYPPVVYAPYGYAYPPPVVVAPPVAYAAPPVPTAAPPPPAKTPSCGPKRFYNTLTGRCDQ